MSSRRAGCCRIGKKPGIVILNGSKRIEGILFETRCNSRIVKLLRAVPARFFSRRSGCRRIAFNPMSHLGHFNISWRDLFFLNMTQVIVILAIKNIRTT